MIELRNYQTECIEEIKKHDTQLIQLPTGSGKTIVFLKYLSENSEKALIVCPTIDLREQIYESALSFYSKHDICKRENNRFKDAKIYILVAMSLNNEIVREYLSSQKLEHIVIDEAHRSQSKTYYNFIEYYRRKNANFKLIGFTATPERLDKKPLLEIFKTITYKKNIYELINEGYLCNVKAYRIKTKEVIKSKGGVGDFQISEIRNLDNYSRNSLIYKTIEENCVGKKTLIFCLSIDHAEKIADYLKSEKKISAYHISGKQSESERKKILLDFKNGKIQILTNCQLLTEGFDEPSIECIIIARPTRSKALYCQMIGRGTRKFLGKKNCELYELTDNCHRICTFNVACDEDKDERFIRNYKDGVSLTDLHKEIEKISLKDFVLDKQEIPLISDFSQFLEQQGILVSQKKSLDELEIKPVGSLNLLQASFVLFKHKLRVKYGFA